MPGEPENSAALMWCAEDLIADLGGSASRHENGRYRDIALHARSHVLLAAAASHIAALDAVYLDIADLDGLRMESEDAAASGFAAKVSIHPNQVPVVRTAFTPTETQLGWARRVVDAVARPDARGAAQIDGRMVDEPILRHARNLLDAASEQIAGGAPMTDSSPNRTWFENPVSPTALNRGRATHHPARGIPAPGQDRADHRHALADLRRTGRPLLPRCEWVANARCPSRSDGIPVRSE